MVHFFCEQTTFGGGSASFHNALIPSSTVDGPHLLWANYLWRMVRLFAQHSKSYLNCGCSTLLWANYLWRMVRIFHNTLSPSSTVDGPLLLWATYLRWMVHIVSNINTITCMYQKPKCEYLTRLNWFMFRLVHRDWLANARARARLTVWFV